MLFQIDSKDLLAIVKVCGRCVDKDSSRFCLGGIRIEISEDRTLVAIGTDGRQLAKYTCKIACGTPFTREFILDIGELRKISARLASGRCSFVSVVELTVGVVASYVFSWDNGLHSTRRKEYQATCRTIDGRFPNWKQVIPTTTPTGSCRIDSMQWVKAWNDSRESVGYVLNVNGTVQVDAPKPPRFERIDHTGDDFSTILNLDWLIGHLSATPSKQVEMHSHGANRPIHLVDQFSEFLIMPMTEQ